MKKWLACLITLTLLGTMFVPGAFSVFAEEAVEVPEEVPEESVLSEETSEDSSGSQTLSEEYGYSSSEESGTSSSEGSSESYVENPESSGLSEEISSEVPDSGSSIEVGTVEEGEVPDGEEFSEEDISDSPEGEADELDASGQAETHLAEAFPDDRKFRTLTFENKKISVKLMLQNEDAVPEDAQLIVRPVRKNDKSYYFDKYIEALNMYEAWDSAMIAPEEEETITYEEVLRRMEVPYYSAENTLLYDVVIAVPVKVGLFTKMVEVLPKDGLVKVAFTFKEDQLADLKVMEKADVSVMYLPFNENIRKEYDSTMKVKDPAVSDIEPEEISCKVRLYGLDDVEKDEVSFVAPGASVFAIRSDKAEVPVVEAAEAAEEAAEEVPEEEAAEEVPAEEVAEEVPVEETAEVIEETEVQAEETAELAPASAEARTGEEAEPTAEPTVKAEPTAEPEVKTEPAESAQPVGEPLEHEEQAETDEIIAKTPKGLEAAFSKKKLAETPVTRTGTGTDGRAFVELAVMKVLIDAKTGELVSDTEWPLEGFAFTLANESGTAQEGMTLPAQTTVEVDAGDPAVNFGAVYFDRAGEYKLVIREVLPEDIVDKVSGSIYYNTDAHTVTIEVVDEGGLQVADVKYDTSADGEESYSELYVLNELMETAEAAELSVRKLQSNNGVKSTVYVRGAQLTILDVEANETAIDPVTGEAIIWETQTQDETFWLEPGHYRLIEEQTPTARHNYWKTITPIDFVVDEGKIYLGDDPEAATAKLVTNPLIVYDDFDLTKYMADVSEVIGGSGSNTDSSDGTNNGNKQEQGVDEAEVAPTKAPQGSDTGLEAGAVETGKTTKKSSSSKKSSSKKSSSSSSSGSSSSSSGSSSGSSSRTVSVSTGGSTSSDSSDSSDGESSTTRTVTVRTDGTTGTPDPNDPNATVTPSGTSVATVSVNGAKPTAAPNTTKAARTGDAAGRNMLLWLMAAAGSLAAAGYTILRARK